tara:strand:+ start:1579 stop:1995 length:417 start_codon:yes stop_codon:yes gene_type:complete
MKKKQYKIHQYNNDGFRYYGIGASTWWSIFLDCHDKSTWRKEFANLLEQKILQYHKQNPVDTELVGAWDHPLLENIHKGPSYSLYHRLLKGCEKHYCVPIGGIKRLPQYDPHAYEERMNIYECKQKNEFYSQHRNRNS